MDDWDYDDIVDFWEKYPNNEVSLIEKLAMEFEIKKEDF